jgi:hypothetical protein
MSIHTLAAAVMALSTAIGFCGAVIAFGQASFGHHG